MFCVRATKHLQKDSISTRQTERELIHQGAGALADSVAKGANICSPYLILLCCHPTAYSPKWALALWADQEDVEQEKIKTSCMCPFGVFFLHFFNTMCNLTDI